MTDAPTVGTVPDGWRETETDSRTVLDLGPASVTTATVVYDDEGLRDRASERAGIDDPLRFGFAARVDVPGRSASRALRALVASRANAGFRDRLTDRGFAEVDRAESRTLAVGGAEADATRYEAVCRLAGATLDVDGWLAVWPDSADDRSFLLAGGAYPTRVRASRDESTATALRDLITPAAFREDLFAFVRSVG